ncbi:coiled-coil domain-containing protein 43-like isoform X2 [Topomyia yanbarensis]|uniref:coiled-coil domain-containing protein 43-like isoform X2 n=1 Tax=Topomyia yanbarensis TaxID=2498891 RepID=UPI00273B1EDC|nr:coiled-coil domain-containing protein 43-like isoform X2 [Topomyia yanbarensis]
MREFSVPTLRAFWRVMRATMRKSKLSKASWRRSLSESDLNSFIKEILDKWKICHSVEPLATGPSLKLDVDEQLAKLLENQKLAKKVEREYTEEERRIKQQILSQYSQLSESDHEDAEDDPGAGGSAGGTSSEGGLTRNTNAADVAALVREKREQSKLESQQKKEKDRLDREKQKQLREEKKEKRKTVKGERRR